MNTIISKNDNYSIALETQKKLVAYELQIKELKQRSDELKEQIKQEMIDNGIVKIDTDSLLISYIEPGEREVFNKKKFQEEHSDLYDEYVEFKPIADSIRVKIK